MTRNLENRLGFLIDQLIPIAKGRGWFADNPNNPHIPHEGYHGNDKIGKELFMLDGTKINFSQKDTQKSLNELFGKKLSNEEILGLSGAPNGSEVQISGTSPNFQLTISHPTYFSKDPLFLDLDKTKEGIILEISLFDLDKKYQGQGLGTRIFARQVVNASQLGVNSIKMVAEKSLQANGYYTWARLGVNNEQGYSSITKETNNLLKEKGYSDIQNAMKTTEGRTWWKKNGTSFEGIFDLSPNSTSMRVLKEYIREKDYYIG